MLWGEHEALGYCVATALPVKYQITAHRLWRVAKLPSLYCLQKCGEKMLQLACHKVVPYNGGICPT